MSHSVTRTLDCQNTTAVQKFRNAYSEQWAEAQLASSRGGEDRIRLARPAHKAAEAIGAVALD